jgi:integrase
MPSVKITDSLLLKTVTKRTKFYDTVCAGLYADASPTNVSFVWKFTHPRYGTAQKTYAIGKFVVGTLGTDDARKVVADLRLDLHKRGIDILAARQEITVGQQGWKSFNEVADEYVAWCAHPVKVDYADVPLPRKASYGNIASMLKHARAAFGRKAISAVTPDDIATLVRRLKEHDDKPAQARAVRACLHALFEWASEAGTDRNYVQINPVKGRMPKLGKKNRRQRFLDAAEIKTLWHGLDRPDLPCERHVALAYKLILCTMLRPGEVLKTRRDEIKDFGGQIGLANDIPAINVKKRRYIVQPMNTLAAEIIAELKAMPSENGMLFPAGGRGATAQRLLLSDRLRGRPKGLLREKDGAPIRSSASASSLA